MNTTIVSNGKDKYKALILGKVTEGETVYTIAVTKHGGIWYTGDWATDKWHFLSEKAFAERFPLLANETLNDMDNLARIRVEMDKVGLLTL